MNALLDLERTQRFEATPWIVFLVWLFPHVLKL